MSGSYHQALYGYEDGHRLIASSTQIPAETGRRLRSLTDMSFDGKAGSYLTCLPLEEMGCYALIRSWPAPDVIRPGAVWSHVILLDFVDLGSFEYLGGLLRLFRCPQEKQDEWPGGPYEKPKLLPRSMASLPKGQTRFPEDERRRVLGAAYDVKDGGLLRCEQVEALEPFLFELWSQQWPRLRRAFAFRTRHRVGGSSIDFDLQLVERLHRDQQTADRDSDSGRWLERLDEDLIKPTRSFRAFLRQFGAESNNGKGDLASLVGLKLALEHKAAPADLSRELCAGFPRQKEMAGLKQALLGRLESKKPLGLRQECDRLQAILSASPASSLSMRALEFQPRVQDLWSDEPDAAIRLLVGLGEFEPSNKAAVSALIETSIPMVGASAIVTLAEADVQLALAIASKREDLVQSPTLWRVSEEFTDGLLELSATVDSETRCRVLITLLKNNVSAAGEVLAQEPLLWWPAVSWGAETIAAGRSLMRTTSSLERALNVVGPGGVGSTPSRLKPEERLVLGAVAPPSAGLWRQVGAAEWSELTESVASLKDDPIRHRCLIVLIAASALPAEPEVRRKLWLAAFPPLHEAVTSGTVSRADLGALSDLLPKPEKDWPERLRRGLVKEIKRDHWKASEVEQVLHLPSDQRDEVLAALKPKKKKRHWLLDIISP